ncbi:Uncharacterized protein dnm_019400 [Desulfonema magnum]|uniref:Uncharacterized protein n=1 Tax=Desulfonema magnum TaxID=45655 RepID=A0A975BIG2_9BACT|nr:Uncharacterized protein dnm_019400 [Desulfonema magnum]
MRKETRLFFRTRRSSPPEKAGFLPRSPCPPCDTPKTFRSAEILKKQNAKTDQNLISFLCFGAEAQFRDVSRHKSETWKRGFAGLMRNF